MQLLGIEPAASSGLLDQKKKKKTAEFSLCHLIRIHISSIDFK